MKPEDYELHTKLLRLFKGAVKAYEEWLNAKKEKAA